jgi:hypothetical protein
LSVEARTWIEALSFGLFRLSFGQFELRMATVDGMMETGAIRRYSIVA